MAWAELILVMEDAHARLIHRRFRTTTSPVVVLDVPDQYRLMDPELVAILRGAVEPILDGALGTEQDAAGLG